MLLILAQAATAAADTATAAKGVTVEQLSLLELVVKGGWVMIPILSLFAAASYIFFERYMTIRKYGTVDSRVLFSIKENIISGNLDAVTRICQSDPSLLGKVLEKGVNRLGSSIQEIEAGIEAAAKASISQLEKNVGLLGAISTIAPMFGFLGTVMGMIRTFSDIAVTDNLSIGVIANGIYEKMVTSAAGLIVGILAHMGYIALENMIERTTIQLEAAANEFLDLLYKPNA